MKTRLYLDVDGVINAYQANGWGKLASGRAPAEGMAWKIVWAPKMVEALAELEVELVWTTTWRDYAVRSIAPLIGWGEHGRVLHPLEPQGNESSIWWKSRAVVDDQQKSPSPFIWIDDELSDLEREDKIPDLPHGLFICPDPRLGIKTSHLERIREYIATQEGVA